MPAGNRLVGLLDQVGAGDAGDSVIERTAFGGVIR